VQLFILVTINLSLLIILSSLSYISEFDDIPYLSMVGC
jgi:hypothetical protein